MSREIFTGRSSEEKAPLPEFPGTTEPGDDWFDGNELVRDWSVGRWTDVSELFMNRSTAIKVADE